MNKNKKDSDGVITMHNYFSVKRARNFVAEFWLHKLQETFRISDTIHPYHAAGNLDLKRIWTIVLITKKHETVIIRNLGKFWCPSSLVANPKCRLRDNGVYEARPFSTTNFLLTFSGQNKKEIKVTRLPRHSDVTVKSFDEGPTLLVLAS